ncbi:MAG: ATP-binding protein [Succinivibrio sp.]|jgi:AAA+ ATPase superfamily predicted ATPase|nr:ATP-binding protein [Succinivibrio sp.]
MAASKIIGRRKEQALIESRINSDRAEFIAIYGRRRVGKTFLVKEMLGDRLDFYVTGIYDRSKKEQLANFNRQLNTYSKAFYPQANDWFEAFAQLQHYILHLKTRGSIIIFIDELPWMDTPRSKFIRALELFWNEFASSCANIKLIACGSATTWMVSKLLGDRGGLHNRVTCPIRLRSFNLAETEEYLLKNGFPEDRKQFLEAYMILGGTPFYLSMLSKAQSVTQNIDSLFFAEGAPLREEYAFLFRSLFKDAPSYKKIVELLAKKNKGMTKREIVSSLALTDNGNLTEILENLCRCDFIRKYNAFGKIERDVMYQLVDNYCLFYLRFIKNNNSQDQQRWSHALGSGARRAWSGYAFEQVCLRHIDQIKKKLGIGHILTDVCSWQNAQAQIDLVIERDDHTINLCEMKYSDSPYVISKAYLNQFEARRDLFRESTRTKKALQLTVVSPYGIKPNAQAKKIQGIVTLDDLFKPDN